jgi:hypothetical protein
MSNQLFDILFLLYVAGSKQLVFMSIISIFCVKADMKITVIMPTVTYGGRERCAQVVGGEA